MSIRFVAMETSIVEALRHGHPDSNGQTAERRVAPDNGYPCRHCLGPIAKGEPFLVLAHRPFPAPQPYAEVGPIFLHAEPCERYPSTGATPGMFMKPGRRYLLKGYHSDDRIFYGTGQIVEPDDVASAAAKILERPDVAYVHVRSALNNCFQCRIDRA